MLISLFRKCLREIRLAVAYFSNEPNDCCLLMGVIIVIIFLYSLFRRVHWNLLYSNYLLSIINFLVQVYFLIGTQIFLYIFTNNKLVPIQIMHIYHCSCDSIFTFSKLEQVCLLQIYEGIFASQLGGIPVTYL